MLTFTVNYGLKLSLISKLVCAGYSAGKISCSQRDNVAGFLADIKIRCKIFLNILGRGNSNSEVNPDENPCTPSKEFSSDLPYGKS